MIWLAPFPLLLALAGNSSLDLTLRFFLHTFFSHFGMAFWVFVILMIWDS